MTTTATAAFGRAGARARDSAARSAACSPPEEITYKQECLQGAARGGGDAGAGHARADPEGKDQEPVAKDVEHPAGDDGRQRIPRRAVIADQTGQRQGEHRPRPGEDDPEAIFARQRRQGVVRAAESPEGVPGEQDGGGHGHADRRAEQKGEREPCVALAPVAAPAGRRQQDGPAHAQERPKEGHQPETWDEDGGGGRAGGPYAVADGDGVDDAVHGGYRRAAERRDKVGAPMAAQGAIQQGVGWAVGMSSFHGLFQGKRI